MICTNKAINWKKGKIRTIHFSSFACKRQVYELVKYFLSTAWNLNLCIHFALNSFYFYCQFLFRRGWKIANKFQNGKWFLLFSRHEKKTAIHSTSWWYKKWFFYSKFSFEKFRKCLYRIWKDIFQWFLQLHLL